MKKLLLIAAVVGCSAPLAFAQAVDARLISLTVPKYVSEEGSEKITGIVKNGGSETLSDFDIHWTDGINTFTYTVTEDVSSGGNYYFTLPDEITTVPSGYSATITVTVDAEGDEDADNDSMSETVEGLPFVPVKIVVGEEATGTWCGWCPRGAVWMEYMEEHYPETWIGIAVHNSDPMEVTAYDDWMGTQISGYPSAMVDRGSDIDPSDFESRYESAIGDFALARLDLKPLIDDQDEVWVHVRTEFAKDSDRDMALAIVIVEDGVTGTASGYSQVNYYSYQSQNIPLVGAGHDWQQAPYNVPAADMVYDDVARELLTDIEGEDGSMPSSVSAGDVVSFELDKFTWSSDYAKENSRIVAMLVNTSSGDVINAAESELIEYEVIEENGFTYYVFEGDTFKIGYNGDFVPTGVEAVASDVLDVNVYPNPAKDQLNIKGLNGLSQVRIYDMKGAMVLETNLAGTSIDISGLEAGVYAVSIVNKGETTMTKISVVK